MDAFLYEQKIPLRDLRQTEKKEIMEIAIVMKAGHFPYIVEFYGCLIRDVSGGHTRHMQCVYTANSLASSRVTFGYAWS